MIQRVMRTMIKCQVQAGTRERAQDQTKKVNKISNLMKSTKYLMQQLKIYAEKKL